MVCSRNEFGFINIIDVLIFKLESSFSANPTMKSNKTDVWLPIFQFKLLNIAVFIRILCLDVFKIVVIIN